MYYPLLPRAKPSTSSQSVSVDDSHSQNKDPTSPQSFNIRYSHNHGQTFPQSLNTHNSHNHGHNIDHTYPQALNILDSHCHSQNIDPRVDFDKTRLEHRHNVHYHNVTQTMVSDNFSEDRPHPWVSLKELPPINLCDMKVGRVHYGQALYGRLCVEAFIVSSIVTLLEDKNGMAVRLCIVPCTSSLSHIPNLLPKDSNVAIKQPYLSRSVDGIVSIYIDNIWDILRSEMPLYIHKKDHNQHVNDGNQRFREKDWEGAIESYTCCIVLLYSRFLLLTHEALAEERHTELLAYTNRSGAWLKLNKFEEALRDSIRALEIDPNHVKSLYQKGCALSGLYYYKQACFSLEEALIKDPQNKEIQEALQESRGCSGSGILNVNCWKDFLIARMLNRYVVPPDCCDYKGSVEVRMTADGCGRGLFAKRNVKAGELLLVSNPLALIRRDQRPVNSTTDPAAQSLDIACEDLITAVTALVMSSCKALYQLYFLQEDSGCSNSRLPPMELFENVMDRDRPPDDSVTTKDVNVSFIRGAVHANLFTGYSISNKLSMPEAMSMPWFVGLWVLPSFINHSCLRNAKRTHVGDALLIHATSNIAEGEEITISYFDTLLPLCLREKKFEDLGFNCSCKRCLVEGRSDSKRLENISGMFAFLNERAAKEATAAVRAGKSFRAELPECAMFGMLAATLENQINGLINLTALQRNWIRASYANAYIAGLMTSGLRCPLSATEIWEVISSAAPGHTGALSIIAWGCTLDSDQAMDACISSYGKWSPRVLKRIIGLHGISPPFRGNLYV